jgi:hypothetical protein
MLASDQVEEFVTLVASLDRQTLKQQLAEYRGNFPLDFTSDFLDSLSLDRLRHVFLAVCLQNQRLPQIEAESAMELVA